MSYRTHRGFSTLEIIIAFALLCIVLAGVAGAFFGTRYWTMALETSSEGLAIAQVKLDDLRAAAAADFQSVRAMPFSPFGDCSERDLCYYTETAVVDVSPCAKVLDVRSSWRTERFPTSTASLIDYRVDFPHLRALGADCGMSPFVPLWSSVDAFMSFPLLGDPVGIDALDGIAYVIDNNPARLVAIAADGYNDDYVFSDDAMLNALDVAHDVAEHKTYAFIAATSSQLRVLDVSDLSAIDEVASTTLAGVPAGVEQGWRLQYYDGFVYIVTRFLNRPSAKEFHILDVSDTAAPIEIGSHKLNTSAHAILVRDQKVNDVTHRFAYLATTHASRELMVFDVTDPASIASVASCDLPSGQQGTALFMLGNMLYFGRENVPSGGEDLYAYDASDPAASNFCTPLARTDINDDRFSRHVQAIHGEGEYLFVATNNTTNAHGKIQIRSRENFAMITALDVDALVENGIDYDADAGILYAITAGSHPALYLLKAEE